MLLSCVIVLKASENSFQSIFDTFHLRLVQCFVVKTWPLVNLKWTDFFFLGRYLQKHFYLSPNNKNVHPDNGTMPPAEESGQVRKPKSCTVNTVHTVECRWTTNFGLYTLSYPVSCMLSFQSYFSLLERSFMDCVQVCSLLLLFDTSGA